VSENLKTIGFLGVAALLCVVASLTGHGAVEQELFSDEGETFFPQFTDPAAATELLVWSFDAASSQIVPFDVKRDDRGVWTIPSHYDYPADAKTRMAKSATMLIGIKKDRVISDRVDDHKLYGVVDPQEESVATEGRGTKVAFKNKAGTVLAELIVGKKLDANPDMQYVRVPGKKRVYAAKFDNQLSTKFADWIETDLLKAKSWEIQKVVFDNYSVDEQQGTIVRGDKIVVQKDSASKWTVDGIADDQEPNEDKLRAIGDSLGQIKIVGVRRKPEGLTAALKQATGIDRLALQQMLQSKGYFLDNRGDLVSNEGDLIFETNKGVRYTLRFGEIVAGEGDAVTSGNTEAKPAKPQDGEQGPQPVTGNNRFLMVTAEFDKTLLKEPTGLRLSADELGKRRDAKTAIEAIQKAIDAYRDKHDKALPESLLQLTEKPADDQPALLPKLDKDPWGQDYRYVRQGDTFVVSSNGADQKEGGEGAGLDVLSDQLAKEDELRQQADEWTQYDRKIDDGRKEAESLTKRFGPWYYVIDNELFQKLKPTRADLVKKKEAPAKDASGTSADAAHGTSATEPGK
jgi:Domain of unknown function (DUF4340)/Type II secretion system (T2SS), protein G